MSNIANANRNFSKPSLNNFFMMHRFTISLHSMK
jgi:hypothetical protein